jgi:hypothetical protein
VKAKPVYYSCICMAVRQAGEEKCQTKDLITVNEGRIGNN